MIKRIGGVLGTLVFAAPFLFAGSTGTTGTAPTPAQIAAEIVERLTVLLTLTADQQTSATTIFTTEQTTLAGIETSLVTGRAALKTAILANDTATIATVSAAIGTLLGQEVLADATAQAAFYAILDTTQQTKYSQLIQTGILGPGPGVPGGSGGRGGKGGH